MENLKLIGSKFLKVNAERNPDFSGKLEVKTNINLNSIDKIKESKDSIKVHYDFNVNYRDLGKIDINGILYLSSDSKTVKEILKNQEDKNYNTPEHIIITNLIVQKASIKAIELEEELGLPIHIKLPTLSVKKD